MREETCCECGEPTGRAGNSEDSLYLYSFAGNEWGPLCEDCYRFHAGRDGEWYTYDPTEFATPP